MLIGIDGGGSKNELLLFTSDGKILRRMVFTGGSVSELGAQAACIRLVEQLRVLLSDEDGLNTPVRALFAGLSGGGNPKMREEIMRSLQHALPNAVSVRTAGDTLTALYAGLGAQDGMAIIAGTGSSAFVRHQGQFTTVGGWGHLIDDAGSGFFLGREALNAALREKDGRSEHTLLTVMVDEQLQRDVRTCIPELYAKGKSAVAAFAPLIFAAAEQNDPIAISVLHHAADELSLLIRAGAKLLTRAPYKTALVGSLWNAPLLQDAVRERLSAEYELFQPMVPAVLGSALCAAEDAGLDAENIRSLLLDALTDAPIERGVIPC